MLRTAMIAALTTYDRKQATKRGYNRYALGQYFARADEVLADIEAGADVRAAVVNGFSGRIAAAVLKELKLPAYTREDAIGGFLAYRPLCGEGASEPREWSERSR
jgi:hypothetical protein